MNPSNRVRFSLTILSLLFLLLGAFPESRSLQARTVVLGAFEEELTWLDAQLVNRSEQQIMGLTFATGELAGRPIVLALTGVGKVNAALTTTLVIEHFQPNEIIFTGVAGGIDPDLLPGDIVIGARTVQHDLGDMYPDSIVRFGVRNPLNNRRNPVFFASDSKLLAHAQKAAEEVEFEVIPTSMGERLPTVITGVIATGDAFITSTPKKGELRENLNADAVEMEGAAVAQICYQFGVPFLIIRALSDKSDENAMQDFERFYQVAARNANRLVLEILSQLQHGPERGDWKVYSDTKYGFEFQYPPSDSLKLLQDPRGGLIMAILKSPAGVDLAQINLDNISSYPRAFQRNELATFQDAAVFIAKNMSCADGPDGSRYCDKVDVTNRFLNTSGIEVLELQLTETVEDYNAGTTTAEPRGPVYALNLEVEGVRLILLVEPVVGSEMGEESLRSIVNSVK